MEYKHDLEYLADLMDNLDKAKLVLESIYYEKVLECPLYSYDSEAFEAFCNHPKVIRGVYARTDCRHCPYYRSSKESAKK